MTKPRRPLKGLFAKTDEPDTSISAEAGLAPSSNDEHFGNVAAAITRVRQGFDDNRLNREHWSEDEYVETIRRLDVAQTEAFFLKGKLLMEAKERYFEDNRRGWRNFAEAKLGLNYTTANQYIRVAREFDVTSHHRSDFGFEHYKALLPLSPESRTILLENLPEVSVKKLREVVQQELAKQPAQPAGHSQHRNLLRQIISLGQTLDRVNPTGLHQRDKWQISAACLQMAADLQSLASQLASRKHEREDDTDIRILLNATLDERESAHLPN